MSQLWTYVIVVIGLLIACALFALFAAHHSEWTDAQ